MVKYLTKRVLMAVFIFLGITLIVYGVSNIAPGGPLDVLAASGNLSKEDLNALKVSMGLDKPVIVRYILWLGDLFRGDLGTSYSNSQPVITLINQRFFPTILLGGVSLIVSMLIGIPLGVISACKQYSKIDSITSAYAFLTQATPSFFICFFLIYIFATKLNWLPASGMYYNDRPQTIGALAIHMVLPVIVMSFSTIGAYIRQTRSALLEVLNEDYMKTARAKGISKRKVILKHGLRNALLPIVTATGMQITFLVGGTVIVEQIFAWPGLGSLMMTGISTRDYPVIMGVTVVISSVVLILNIVLDIVYALLDPRISLEGGR